MMFIIKSIWLFICIFLFQSFFTACSVKRPDNVLSEKEMESYLYDYHVAVSAVDNLNGAELYKRELYIDNLLTKHGITEAVFDSSLVWYSNHPDLLVKIYESINDKLRKRRDELNHLIAIRENKSTESSEGDSIDLWSWRQLYVLSGLNQSNTITFSIPYDSHFEDRDTIRLTARARFYGGAPIKTSPLTLALSIRYINDSVISKHTQLTANQVESINLYSDTLGQIKEIEGFFYFPKQQTSRIAVVDQISLYRFHAKQPYIKPLLNDSVQLANNSDSIIIPK